MKDRQDTAGTQTDRQINTQAKQEKKKQKRKAHIRSLKTCEYRSEKYSLTASNR